jgi:DNA polymerase-1
MMDNKRFIIIDGNSLINRAYYAMQRPMITGEGLYTQGIFGFLRMLKKIKKDHPAGYIGVAFDMKGPTFRHEQYDQYKAGRKGMPPELAMQMPVLKDVLDALRIKWIEKEGFEADDLIGTLARNGEEQGLEPLIVTGDKDELQLASEKTGVIITRKGISEFDYYDHDAMMEKYGFTPAQFIDCKALMGDNSDNVPGVPGIGEKTAVKLICEFGSVENLLENTARLKGKQKENIEANRQRILMSKMLVTIDVNVPVDIDLEEYRWEEPDYPELLKIYRKLEFKSFIKEIPGDKIEAEDVDEEVAGGADEAELRSQLVKALEATEKIIVREAADAAVLDEAIKEALSLDGHAGIKTFGDADKVGCSGMEKEILTGMGILVGNRFCYFDLENAELREKVREILEKRIREGGIAFCGTDLKMDYIRLMSLGLERFDSAADVTIAKYITESGRTSSDISLLAREHLAFEIESESEFADSVSQIDMFGDKTELMSDYAFRYCLVSRYLGMLFASKIASEGMTKIYKEVELPLIQVMAAMQYAGFNVDVEVLKEIGSELSAGIDRLTGEIYDLAGEEFNIKSPSQLGPILFEKLGLPAGKKTKKGYSTSAEVLEKIAGEHEIVPRILEYRSLTKLQGTYIDGLIPLIKDDGRIHAHFNQTVAATGRISSSDPNLQNIPVRTELGRMIRKAFVPRDEDSILMGADYSQIELRVLAHMSGDETLIEAFNRGEDIHRATAANVLGVPKDRITPLERSRAKAVNFGVIYGMSAFGLSSELGISRKKADNYIKDYFAKHEKVRSFMDEQVALAKSTGSVSTMLGRKRYIKEINASNYMVRQLGERLAMNSPIQGSAADIIKIAMINIYKALLPYRSELVLQVHDELIINTYREEEEEVKGLLRKTMEEAMELKVKLSVELNEGDNWYVLK